MDDLVAGVELLCLDAGNTVIFLDHERLGALCGIEPSVLVRTEGEAKRLAEEDALHDCAWGGKHLPGAAGWGKMVGTIALRGGLAEERVPAFLDAAWADHVAKNLWCKVPEGLGAALDGLRATGVHVAIISNSEGMLERLFTELGVLGHFDLVVDSGKAGVEKPDPRIFRIAFDRFGVRPEHALHLGDVYATDVLGARAAGCRVGLVDPFGHYEGRHLDVPRVPGAPEVARAIVSSGGPRGDR
ncbi:MAG: HAD-IA family hydrolase [Labilithrix sp.]|nr:HAD-IA family hydrolase [Labilithrix sp.]MCW5811703.1 HAD-IA family hydrolase [Labilithrix sp.]